MLLSFLCTAAAQLALVAVAAATSGKPAPDMPPKFDMKNTMKYVEELVADGDPNKAIHILRGLAKRDQECAQRLAKIYMDETRYEEALKVLKDDVLQLDADADIADLAEHIGSVDFDDESAVGGDATEVTADAPKLANHQEDEVEEDETAGGEDRDDDGTMRDTGGSSRSRSAGTITKSASFSTKKPQAPRTAFPEAWNNLGWVYERLNQNDKAVEAYITATKLRPMVASYWYNLGTCLLKIGPQAQHQGVSSLERAHQLAPQDEGILANLGVATANKELLAKTKSARGQQAYAQLLWQDGDFEEAVRAFETAKMFDVNDADIAFQLALARYQARGEDAVPRECRGRVGISGGGGTPARSGPSTSDSQDDQADEGEVEASSAMTDSYCEQQRRKEQGRWRKELAKALALRKSADTLTYGDRVLDASVLTFLIRGGSPKQVRKMRRLESETLRPSVAQQVDRIREQESDPIWQARFATECVDRLGDTPSISDEIISKKAASSRNNRKSAASSRARSSSTDRSSSGKNSNSAIFPAACGYGLVWTTSWHRVHMRLEDGALGEAEEYRHITENWAVVVVGGANGGGCAFPWIRKRECLVVDVLCDVFRNSGDGFFCRDPKMPASWNRLEVEDPASAKRAEAAIAAEKAEAAKAVGKRKKKAGSTRTSKNNNKVEVIERGAPAAGGAVAADTTGSRGFADYLQYQDSETIANITGMAEVGADPRYMQFVRENKIGTVVVQSFFWPAEKVREEILFWVKTLPISGDIFLFEKDYQANRGLVDEHFKMLYRHGMEVSWSEQKVEMVQLQKKIDRLRRAFDRKALEDIARVEERWRAEKEERNWRITQMISSSFSGRASTPGRAAAPESTHAEASDPFSSANTYEGDDEADDLEWDEL
mmetsp:Transcript_4134/g.10086  ORF Transcript_4134/g.10086 Transcript_4134/m.10086 type:complete len:891 (+) Transcript_4134:401-3073(+)|eukprot:CAMPEP_0179009314 /NCGR_PEP_ID=MMETSP0795-20121207/16206_1 /TAXON_ID=88552 /ORGANISM="Amoebophrya sp., Strain Ameob2" /LENGTH=890 /DNA_ID=CAMNT_0020704503 /DNA_START=366 /DNA_END=3038 /DNA_ORIENTATION=-